MKNSRLRTLTLELFAGPLAASLLTGCAAHRLEVAQEEAARTKAIGVVHDCIVGFAVTNDSPRLTGYELVDAAEAACLPQTRSLAQLAEDQGFDPPYVHGLVGETVKESKNDALSGLAVRNHKAAGKPGADAGT